MTIKNYDPIKIEKSFNNLKESNKNINKNHKKMFNRNMFAITIMQVLSLIILIALNINISKLGLTPIIITSVITGTLIVIGGIIFFRGPEHDPLKRKMTFAMNFWDLYKQVNILSIDLSDTANYIIITYENKDHIVRKKHMCVDIVMKTDATESYLDVENGYVVMPYVVEKQPILQ